MDRLGRKVQQSIGAFKNSVGRKKHPVPSLGTPLTSRNHLFCFRCQVKLGKLLNRGTLCPLCRRKVCKKCLANQSTTCSAGSLQLLPRPLSSQLKSCSASSLSSPPFGLQRPASIAIAYTSYGHSCSRSSADLLETYGTYSSAYASTPTLIGVCSSPQPSHHPPSSSSSPSSSPSFPASPKQHQSSPFAAVPHSTCQQQHSVHSAISWDQLSDFDFVRPTHLLPSESSRTVSCLSLECSPRPDTRPPTLLQRAATLGNISDLRHVRKPPKSASARLAAAAGRKCNTLWKRSSATIAAGSWTLYQKTTGLARKGVLANGKEMSKKAATLSTTDTSVYRCKLKGLCDHCCRKMWVFFW